ncbi:hypothetical protein ABT025_16145 [Streptomyces sp. NPDC002809]|uniref:hypothetical protein n=1 Tax=Streptomyces sp. NPDC002809 TaxID=3154433 RepID=UPI0033278277
MVTGSPGVGKSALLGRLVVENSEVTRRPDLSELTGLSDPRDLEWLLGVFQEKGRIHAAIHARHKLLSDLVAAVADAAGMPGGTGREELLHALAQRSEPLVLVIDALDEAGTASGDGGGGEAEHIASVLPHPLRRSRVYGSSSVPDRGLSKPWAAGSPPWMDDPQWVRTDAQGHHVLSWQGDTPAPRVWTLRSPTGPPSRRKHHDRLWPTLSAGQYAAASRSSSSTGSSTLSRGTM